MQILQYQHILPAAVPRGSPRLPAEPLRCGEPPGCCAAAAAASLASPMAPAVALGLRSMDGSLGTVEVACWVQEVEQGQPMSGEGSGKGQVCHAEEVNQEQHR